MLYDIWMTGTLITWPSFLGSSFSFRIALLFDSETFQSRKRFDSANDN